LGVSEGVTVSVGMIGVTVKVRVGVMGVADGGMVSVAG
jgi:hypothetical protein